MVLNPASHALLTAALTPSGGLGPERLLWLAVVVFIGAVVPVVPTGAAVSATAVLADQDPLVLVIVVALGAAGAWGGDVVTLILLKWGGGRVLHRLITRIRRSGGRAARLPERLREHDLRVLLVSRLVPGGADPGAARRGPAELWTCVDSPATTSLPACCGPRSTPPSASPAARSSDHQPSRSWSRWRSSSSAPMWPAASRRTVRAGIRDRTVPRPAAPRRARPRTWLPATQTVS